MLPLIYPSLRRQILASPRSVFIPLQTAVKASNCRQFTTTNPSKMPIEDSKNAQEATNLQERANILNNAHQALKTSCIIPDVLDDFTPTARLQILYPKSTEVLLGNEITPPESQERPIVTATIPGASAEECKNYAIIMTDPDAPSRENPKWAEYCHWIAPLPEAAVLQAGDRAAAEQKHKTTNEQRMVKKESDVVEYMGPAPPAKTGKHRYVFILVKGDTSKLKAPSDRPNWGTGKPRHGVRQWVKEHGLEVVGANFFYAQNKKQENSSM